MDQHRITPLTESGLLAALLVVLAMTAVYMPVVGMIATMLWPLPVIVLVVRHGLRQGVLGVIVAGVIMALLIEPVTAVNMVLSFGPTGLAIGYGFHRQWRGEAVFGAGLGASIAGKLLVMGLLFVLSGVNPFTGHMDVVQQTFEETFAMYEEIGVSEEDIAQARSQMEMGMQAVSMLLPLIIVIMGLLDTVVSYLVGQRVLRRLGLPVSEMPPFSEWKLPRGIVLLTGFALVGLYWGHSRDIQLLYELSVNLIVFTMMAGAVQGFSLLSALMQHFRLSGFVRALIYVLVILNGVFVQIVALTGLFDMLFDYRRRFRSRG